MHEHRVDRVHSESVVLDIGEDIGSLLIYTPPALRGREIEVSPKDQPESRTHVEVLERLVNGRTVFAAAFPGLHSGIYSIWATDGTVAAYVNVTGGQVATVDWR